MMRQKRKQICPTGRPRAQRGVAVLFLVFVVSVVGLLLAFNMNLLGYKQAHNSINEYHSKIAFANAQSAQELVRFHVEQLLGDYFADDSAFAMTYADPAGRYTAEIRDDGDAANKVLEFTAVGRDTYDAAPNEKGRTLATTTITGKINLDQGGKIYDWIEEQATTTIAE